MLMALSNGPEVGHYFLIEIGFNRVRGLNSPGLPRNRFLHAKRYPAACRGEFH